MITATITNVIRDGVGVRVFYVLSTGDDRSRLFMLTDDADKIKNAVRADCDEIQAALDKAAALSTELQGIII